MLSAVYSNRVWLAESIAFGLAALLFNVCGLITVRMAPGFVLQQSLTGFSLVSLPVLSMNIFVKAPHGLNSPLDSNHFSWVINHDNQSRKPLFFFFSEQWLLWLYHTRGWEGNTLQLWSYSTESVLLCGWCGFMVVLFNWAGLWVTTSEGSVSQGRARRRKKLFF